MAASPFFSWQHAILKSALEPTTKLVCHTINAHMAADGTGCFPSYRLIAEESGLGRSTVIAHVQKAADAGYLTITNRDRDNGSHTSNLYQPTMPGGGPAPGLGVVRQEDQGSPAAGPGVVRQPDPHNSSAKQLNEPPPQSPQGGVWDDDSQFMELLSAYALLNPDRTDARKAWDVWVAKGLKPSFGLIMRALPAFAQRQSWKKEERRYVPALSKWLGEEEWRQVAAGIPTAEELAEQRRIGKEGLAAYARIETDKRSGRTSMSADVEAVRLWHEQQDRLKQKTKESE